jgi:hypothetical protein
MPVVTENSAHTMLPHAFKAYTVHDAELLASRAKHRSYSRPMLLLPNNGENIFMKCAKRCKAQTIPHKAADFQQHVVRCLELGASVQ